MQEDEDHSTANHQEEEPTDLAYCICYRLGVTKEESTHKHWLEQCFTHRKKKRHRRAASVSVSRSPTATGHSPQPLRVVGLHTTLSTADENLFLPCWGQYSSGLARSHKSKHLSNTKEFTAISHSEWGVGKSLLTRKKNLGPSSSSAPKIHVGECSRPGVLYRNTICPTEKKNKKRIHGTT